MNYEYQSVQKARRSFGLYFAAKVKHHASQTANEIINGGNKRERPLSCLPSTAGTRKAARA